MCHMETCWRTDQAGKQHHNKHQTYNPVCLWLEDHCCTCTQLTVKHMAVTCSHKTPECAHCTEKHKAAGAVSVAAEQHTCQANGSLNAVNNMLLYSSPDWGARAGGGSRFGRPRAAGVLCQVWQGFKLGHGFHCRAQHISKRPGSTPGEQFHNK